MIQGLRTVIYPVTKLPEATEWYRQVLGKAPYFEQPFYVGFEVGGFELGLIPDGVPGSAGATAYWGTEDAAAELARLEALGATVDAALADVGEGIRVATVRDPDGNLFGIIENPHFDRSKVA
ncbi:MULTISPECIES: VOC family protein [unclassified Massilia]|uniref:VOC family protein n=1 Tax=unclassified Massilia TaxID=2609279 RepID=UPI001780FB93|nr:MULTISPECIES: VOC family protein [unclassified Massilia]MBD8532195.1 VOC family protein [Massilia sp. CFBP 13647]MBD8675730.1 VOC family protein [Massilia sp. CFBP 13721]